MCYFILVVKAAHTFYNGSTSISVKTGDSTPRKRKTERLNTVVCPEEKRKIIGDTFMRVWNVFFLCYDSAMHIGNIHVH